MNCCKLTLLPFSPWIHRDRSDVDTVGMLLAQSLVFFREEWLTFQAGRAHRTHKAGIMPGESHRLQELIPSLNGEVTTMTVCPKQAVVVLFTVRLSILHVEHVAFDWLIAGRTDETGHMPSLFQGIHDLPEDLLVAACTGGSKELLIAVRTVHLPLLLYEAVIYQGGTAVSTVELLRVPGHAHGHEERTPDHTVAFVTHWGASASWDVLCLLHQSVEVLWVWLWNGAVWTFGRRSSNFAK